jgi:hypothetical protein
MEAERGKLKGGSSKLTTSNEQKVRRIEDRRRRSEVFAGCEFQVSS